MIVGTPDYFPISALDHFDLGDPEGKIDSLLESCLCEIPPIKEFLLGKKDIVLGERGTGKTALFRLLANRILNIHAANNKKSIVLPLDENIEYKQIKDLVENRITYFTKKESVKYQFLWEIFITYKILETLNENNIDDDRILAHKKDISTALGFEKTKIKFMEFLLGHKKTVGVKLDELHPATSTFYISAEPSNKQNPEDTIQINLNQIKKDISRTLDKNNVVLFVLLDRLDEFMILEEYGIQKLLLEGLLACYRNFSTGTPIRIKLFLRTDLFNRLNINDLGADKIIAKSINLCWRQEDLRELVARRISYNLQTQLKISNLKFKTDEGTLHLDPRHIEVTKIIKESLHDHKFKRYIYSFLEKIERALNAKVMNLQRRERKTNYNDRISTEIISLLFPNNCEHTNYTGQKERVLFIDFINSHLSYATGYSTPRLTIAFFDKCLHEARAYYSRNTDIDRIKKNSNNEYEVIKIECITRAYTSLKDDVWNVVKKAADRWERNISNIRGNVNIRDEIFFEDFNKLDKWNSDEEPRQFIAFLVHTGVLSCINSPASIEERKYQFPLLFRDIKQRQSRPRTKSKR